MKNKLLISSVALAIAAIAALNVNMKSAKIQPSALSLTNVEALADESGAVYCEGGFKECAKNLTSTFFKQ